MPLTFVHAADLHLDAPFRGISEAMLHDDGLGLSVAQELRQSTFTALDRLVQVCLEVRADFLLLAGDVYNAADKSLAARLALRDAFVRLQQAGVAVFLVHGNHDPFVPQGQVIPWPENVHVFGPEWGVREVFAAGGRVLVHGVSHASDKEERNLAVLFKQQGQEHGPTDFQIGLMHCALTGNSQGHAAYAPCSATDIAGMNLDYLALGHVHGTQVLAQQGAGNDGRRLMAYPGSLQGLHANEAGPRGCLVVRVAESGRAEARFVPLAPVYWNDLALALDTEGSPQSIPALEEALAAQARQVFAATRRQAEEAWAALGLKAASLEPKACVLTIYLTGSTALDAELRRAGALETLRQRLQATLAGQGVWIRQTRLETRPELDRAAYALRRDLAGEVVRLTDELLGSREEDAAAQAEAKEALKDLFERPKARWVLDAPNDEELRDLVRKAEQLCLNLMDKK